jgi:hypothetical protein
MEEMQPNPLLQPENYHAGYQEKIDELKNRPEAFQLEKMCYELFESYELGRKFIEHVTDNILLKPNGDPETPHYSNKNIWGEGFKAFPLMIMQLVSSHKQRIQAGADDARRNAAKS